MATSYKPFISNCFIQRRISHVSQKSPHFNLPPFPTFKPLKKILPGLPLLIDVQKTMTDAAAKLLEAFVDSFFQFVDQPLLPSQSNFAPVEELGEAILVTSIQGSIPDDFPEGVYIRNGPNPVFGGLKSTNSIFGRSSHIWVEGEGMLHAIYFKRSSQGSWKVLYNNKHVETDTYKIEKQLSKPSFLPAIEGDSLAILSAYLLNWLRFGKVNKYISNTNVFEHSGKFYSVAENHIPQEIDIFTLKTVRNWNVNGAWDRPFTSHPKKAPGTGELVTLGVAPTKPFAVAGIISADGEKLVQRVDLQLNRCTLCHEIGVTKRYIVIMDFPLTIDLNRLLRGGRLIKYNKEEYARIGILPRYGDANSIKWFEVEPNCTFHIINSFEDGHEVVVRGCSSLDSLIPGPNLSLKEHEGLSRCHEWRLNMHSGEVKEKDICGGNVVYMDFPVINGNFIGVRNRYAYTQVVDPIASSDQGAPKYGGLAKLYFEESCKGDKEKAEEGVRVECHMFEKNTFCSGAAFVPIEGGLEEDDGWIIAFVHNEDTNISEVHIIDAKKFSGEVVTKITMPRRVPYGFHGAFMQISFQAQEHNSVYHQQTP
ncbi:carotenoid 9,10(9',10')-cleavage dioxygenase isoform X2 [Vigna radiata var. radiata]|uniref:Carotenoid 9,10(9',10')-cleavage dioxygenase isoform X2 n=1 Tax=Vigna radiata var. radiata TaxID=3916 RepID=A0A1S3U3T5_VIGRR|nr:carotenoid 9,10(9',10')-cleavage dioxygenase isoform X2 [Vigna radiata var. radiata]